MDDHESDMDQYISPCCSRHIRIRLYMRAAEGFAGCYVVCLILLVNIVEELLNRCLWPSSKEVIYELYHLPLLGKHLLELPITFFGWA